jgi:hypothetical protein
MLHSKKFFIHAKNMHQSKSYAEKLKYIETQIESDIQYFNMKNILDEATLKMDAIKANIRQKEKEINRM